MSFLRYDRKTFISSCGPIEVASAYYHCTVCKSSRWPAFETFALQKGRLSEGARRLVAFAGAEEGGFEQSQKLLLRLAGIDVSESTIERYTQEVGEGIKEETILELNKTVEEVSLHQMPTSREEKVEEKKLPKILHLATDGTTVKTQKGHKEVKSAAIYKVSREEEKEAKAEEISYVSSFDRASEFGRKMWAEAVRRGVMESEKVVVLADGAAWIWNLYAMHFPYNRVEILDYYHASEHLSKAARAGFGEGSPQARSWHKKEAQRLLKKGGVERVLRNLEKPKSSSTQGKKEIEETIRYFGNNIERMKYYEYRKEGYHIGSGLAESACKHVVGERLKKSGMTGWSEKGAESVLQVRVAIENERFDQYCDKLLQKRLKVAA